MEKAQRELLLQKIQNDILDPDTAARYLNLYVGDADWMSHMGQLWNRLNKKYSEDQAKQLMKKTIACTTLLPAYDKTKIPETPENLLHWCSSYFQFNERDWFEELKQVISKDIQIEGWRNQCLALGIVYPLEYSPVTRQAFKWLYGKADEAGVITEENKETVVRRFQNLVFAYGGNVVCYVFLKHEGHIRKILNWRTGYFFERAIFDVYTIDQVMKIKAAELKKTNAKLVKSIQKA